MSAPEPQNPAPKKSTGVTLNLVTNGKPEGAVKDFIIWILTEGQQYVNQSGYILLTEADVTAALGKVK